MNEGLIPQRYAKALYKFALDKNNAEQVYGEMKAIADSFETNPDLAKVLSNPFINKEDKGNLLLSAAGTSLEDNYRAFVKLLLDNKREQYAREVALAYRSIYRKANNIACVKIATASELGTELEAKLRTMVSEAYGDMTLEFTFVVIPDLIGGFVIDVDSQRLDASISNEIEQLRHNLLRN
jgi:F-type H+-transporting ATPase subunit delta